MFSFNNGLIILSISPKPILPSIIKITFSSSEMLYSLRIDLAFLIKLLDTGIPVFSKFVSLIPFCIKVFSKVFCIIKYSGFASSIKGQGS